MRDTGWWLWGQCWGRGRGHAAVRATRAIAGSTSPNNRGWGGKRWYQESGGDRASGGGGGVRGGATGRKWTSRCCHLIKVSASVEWVGVSTHTHTHTHTHLSSSISRDDSLSDSCRVRSSLLCFSLCSLRCSLTFSSLRALSSSTICWILSKSKGRICSTCVSEWTIMHTINKLVQEMLNTHTQ